MSRTHRAHYYPTERDRRGRRVQRTRYRRAAAKREASAAMREALAGQERAR